VYFYNAIKAVVILWEKHETRKCRLIAWLWPDCGL